MSKKIIIGRNSSIVNSLTVSNAICISHNDPFDICNGNLVIVFAVDKKHVRGNKELFEKIIKSKPAGIVLISSVSVLVGKDKFYTYVRMKAYQEELLRKTGVNYSILRLSTPEWLSGSERKPNLLFKKKSLENYLNNLSESELKNNLTYLVDYAQSPTKLSDFYYKFYCVFPIWTMRMVDVLMRFFTSSTYGYSIESYYKYNQR
jgi:hypothetical protein